MNGHREVDPGVVQNSGDDADLWRVYTTFVILASVGLVGALLYCAATSTGWLTRATVLGGAVLLSGAFSLVGALLGFLFAIPRSRQEERAVQTVVADSERPRQRLSDYAANTNLEQISDWLTKILVGIGLIQFNKLSERFASAATIMAPLVGDRPSARAFALSLMTYFMIWGFFFAYLSTRLWLPKALSRAEREEEVRKREVEKEAELRALERKAYDYLYEAPPGGFTRAIEAIETYLGKSGSPQSAWSSLYLASAYGQKHAFELAQRRQEEAEKAKEKARAAVEQALRLNPGTRPILEQLYRGTDPNENDLASLRGDPRLDELLGQ